MNITYFIRDNDNFYPEPCDKASIKISKNNKTYYCAARWGSYEPTNVISYIITDPDKLLLGDWVISLGYSIIEEEM